MFIQNVIDFLIIAFTVFIKIQKKQKTSSATPPEPSKKRKTINLNPRYIKRKKMIQFCYYKEPFISFLYLACDLVKNSILL